MHSIYSSLTEELPPNALLPKGKFVCTTIFKDANLMHDFTTSCSVTGILHMINQTLFDWFSKFQGQIETTTYGSDFVAAWPAVKQIIDLHYSLQK